MSISRWICHMPFVFCVFNNEFVLYFGVLPCVSFFLVYSIFVSTIF